MRRSLALCLVVFGLVALPCVARAQVSIWLKRGVSGVGAAVSANGNSDSVAYTVSGGYSYEGYLDFDLGLSYLTFSDKNAIASDLKGFGVTPGFQYHPLKQGPDMPISLGLGVTFNWLSLQSDQLKAVGVEAESLGVGLSVGAYRFFRLGESTGIIPAAGVLYTHTEAKFTGPRGQITNKDDTAAAALGVYFAFIDDGGRIYGIVPSVLIGSSVSFGLEFNLTWSLL
jgi:hypothetical protein